MQKKNFLLSMLAVILFGCIGLTGCSSDDYTYSDFHCNLTIDLRAHMKAPLQAALNSMSPGVFCEISYDARSRSYIFVNNQAQRDSSRLNSVDFQLGNEGKIGMNNGLIVGYGNLSSNDAGGYTFYAFDAQCPNCFNYNTVPMRSYPLTMNSAGIAATCANCKRQYNMNTGGNCVNNSGKGMTQYRASTTGPLGTLYVN